ncbi:DUF6807 family protein, partial [Nonomuraea sp. NPDC004297]
MGHRHLGRGRRADLGHVRPRPARAARAPRQLAQGAAPARVGRRRLRTLGGLTVTDRTPASHPHQLGISVAAPDLDGHNFWGGRTYVAGHGPAWLDNHGTQRHQRWLRRTGTELVH